MENERTIDQSRLKELKPVILSPSITFLVATWFACITALVGGIAMLGENPIMGAIITAVMGFGALIWPLLFTRPWRPRLQITADGLSFGSARWQTRFISWRDVTGVRVGWRGDAPVDINWTKWVFIDYQRNGRQRTYNAYPRLYGINADRLAELIERYLKDAQFALNPVGTSQ